MFINNLSPIAFEILSFEIRWYSLAYIFGILFGWLYCKKKLIKEMELSKLFDDLITYIILGVIIGGRLGYVFFYNISYFFNNPLEIIMIWSGGMSFHGGLIGVIISTFLFSKKHNINSFIFLDLLAIVAPIGIFLGRISNFINSELYGKETEVFWSVKFVLVDNLLRHPSQLYEALFEGLILFILLNHIAKNKIYETPGIISSIFLILYSFFRFILEFFREPDTHIGYLMWGLTLGQILSIVFLFFGLSLYLFKKNES